MLAVLLASGSTAHALDIEELNCNAAKPGEGCYTMYGSTRIDWPAVCPAPVVAGQHDLTPPSVLHTTPAGRLGYDFAQGCMPDLDARNLSWLVPMDNPGPPMPARPPMVPMPAMVEIHVGCLTGEDPDEAFNLLALWIVICLYMFYGLALVCEEFLVPALNVLCERCNIPDDVAGATLMAAGCNAPELFASIMGVFIDHSTVGAGTVVGSAPFNLMCITGAASLAVTGTLRVDCWLMAREIFFLSLALLFMLTMLRDGRVMWWEALMLVVLYVVYALVCVYTQQAVSLLYSVIQRRAPSSMMSTLDEPTAALELAPALRPRKRLTMARDRLSSTLSSTISRSLSTAQSTNTSMPMHAFVPERTGAPPPATPVPNFPMDRPMELGGGLATPLSPPGSPSTTRRGETRAVLDEHAAGWEVLVADCRKRCAVYRQPAPTWAEPLRAVPNGGVAAATAAASSSGAGSSSHGWDLAASIGESYVEGVLLKKSRFYSSIRMGSRTWQQRYFVLDDHPDAPFRYMRLDAGGLHPLRQRYVRIDLRGMREIERVSDQDIHLVSKKGRRHKLRCSTIANDDPWIAQRWFDELIVKTDELRREGESGGRQGGEGGEDDAVADDDEDHDVWYAMPQGLFARALFVLAFPLKLTVHCTVPAVHRKGCEKYYIITLFLAVTWLGILAYVMTTTLDKIGCALAIPSTVMGLTLGAMGTSFPNLYASILTAQAGQAGMSICQAFGSNTFNLCIGLGLVWLMEALAGQCTFGSLFSLGYAACGGCYMPSGFDHACPHLPTYSLPPRSGQLVGTSVVVFFNLLLLLLTFITSRGAVPKPAAYGYFLVYLLYVMYQVGAVYKAFPPICFGDICL